jgi:hypothetical protein
MKEDDLKILAQQLSCPEGDYGIQTGVSMNTTNSNMILSTIADISPQNDDKILEIGPGNASHLAEVLNKAVNLSYTGSMLNSLKGIRLPFMYLMEQGWTLLPALSTEFLLSIPFIFGTGRQSMQRISTGY